MSFSSSALRMGTLVGLFSSGAAVGVLAERNRVQVQGLIPFSKAKAKIEAPKVEDKEGKTIILLELKNLQDINLSTDTSCN